MKDDGGQLTISISKKINKTKKIKEIRKITIKGIMQCVESILINIIKPKT